MQVYFNAFDETMIQANNGVSLYYQAVSVSLTENTDKSIVKRSFYQAKTSQGLNPIESAPSDTIVFNVKLYHSAFGKGVERRGIYLNYI